ncbi:hypothetical protein J7M23_12185 [Candidatus Sumerlaeota bacterium]|nr:hypothetical protein [Candidatus Sumerlaeota bacterium]
MLKESEVKKGTLLLVMWVCLSLLLNSGVAEEQPLPVLKTSPKTVAVFKNGLGFFVREGAVALRDGWAITDQVPDGALGTIWIGSLDKDTTLEEVIALNEDVVFYGSIRVSPEKKVVLQIGEEKVEGTINLITPDAILMTIPKKHKLLLDKNSILKVEFPDKDSISRTLKKVKRIKFKVSSRAENVHIGISYLEKGISWTPSYLINIEDPEKARITMKSTLINDAEDLEDVDVYFVVGYPNFKYADIPSPLTLDQSLTQFIQALESAGKRGTVYRHLSNIMKQRVTFADKEATPVDYGYSAIKGLPGAAEEDLFLYFKKGISLKKGERAYYHIFSDKVDYEHIYEWTIPDTLNISPSGYQRSGEKKEEREQVWHAIKLTNSTQYPWTTAPALVVSEWKPLSQDVLNYTPKGAKTNVKITVATDIKTDRNEYEVDRERDVKIYDYHYDLVTVKGELFIKNFKQKEIKMEIKKSITGKVIEQSHNGKVTKIAEGLRGVNYRSTIVWNISLKPGEETTVTYKYKVYIRH